MLRKVYSYYLQRLVVVHVQQLSQIACRKVAKTSFQMLCVNGAGHQCFGCAVTLDDRLCFGIFRGDSNIPLCPYLAVSFITMMSKRVSDDWEINGCLLCHSRKCLMGLNLAVFLAVSRFHSHIVWHVTNYV